MAQAVHPSGSAGFASTFVERVLDDALSPGTRICGISGLQGTGKSTLAAQLASAAAARGISAATISIDDFYLDRPQRRALAARVHPLLATRGPPGTHDLPLALRTLDALREGAAVRLPRFDKPGDCHVPEALWPRVDSADLVIFEGWCLGVPAEASAALATPLNTLEREEDRDGRWRGWCNDALAQDYPALWRLIDRLLFLRPPGFEVVPGWRWEQERALRGAGQAGAGMARAEVMRFVQHFERVSRQALRTLPGIADTTIALDAQRRPLLP